MSSLVEVMACHLYGDKHYLNQCWHNSLLDLHKQTAVKSKYEYFLSRKYLCEYIAQTPVKLYRYIHMKGCNGISKRPLDSRMYNVYTLYQVIIIIIIIFIIGCFPCSIQWGWQHQAMPNTSSPSVFVLWVNASQATYTDISVDTFRPCVSRPVFPSGAGKR